MQKRTKWLSVVATLLLLAPIYVPGQGNQPVPNQITAPIRTNNAQIVATDVAKTASISMLNLHNALHHLGNSLQGVNESQKKNQMLATFLRHHREFLSVSLYRANSPIVQAGQVRRPDLQKQAILTTTQAKPYVSNLYSSHEVPISVTIGLPVASGSAPDSLVAEADMSRLKELSNLQDKRLGTHTTLPGIDVSSLEANPIKAVVKKVQGTHWKILSTPSPKDTTHTYEGEVLARFPNGLLPSQIQNITKTIQGNLVRSTTRNAFVFKSTQMSVPDLIAVMKKMGADIAEPHLRVRLQALPTEEPNDYLYQPYQANLKQIYADYAWPRATGTPNVTVAVIDTGVALSHPDLAGRFVQGINVLNNHQQPLDDNGHGTHVAGIIGARTNNNQGVAGVNWACKIMPIKALAADGTGSVLDIADGIYWASSHGANVINLSLATYDSSAYLHEAITSVYQHGVVVVAAMGNDGTGKPCYPAAYPEVIGVSAIDSTDKRAGFSNYGASTSLAAPGVSILSTYPGNSYAVMSGTSMAAPHVAGAAALLKSVNPRLTPYQIRSILQSTTHDLGARGKDPYYGYGKVDVYQAVQAAIATTKTIRTTHR